MVRLWQFQNSEGPNVEIVPSSFPDWPRFERATLGGGHLDVANLPKYKYIAVGFIHRNLEMRANGQVTDCPWDGLGGRLS